MSEHENAEQFFVTPSAIDVFDAFIQTYGGRPCESLDADAPVPALGA